MRKKTIKSYFFNSYHTNPAVTSLFLFSKRAAKQRKRLIRSNNLKIHTATHLFRKLVTKLTSKKFFIIYVLYNLWLKDVKQLKLCFFNSFFRKTYAPENRHQLRLWVLLKKYYKRTLFIFLQKYVWLGVLSSHFVHMFNLKNLHYLVRSKYRSKIFDLNKLNYYGYSRAKSVYQHTILRSCKTYFFTENLSKQSLWYDEFHTLQLSEWTNYPARVGSYHSETKTKYLNINSMYSIADYNNVIDKIDLSLLFHENSVEQKLEVLKIAQQTLSPSDLELFFIAHLNTCCNFDCSLYFHKVITHVYNYKYIYDFAEL